VAASRETLLRVVGLMLLVLAFSAVLSGCGEPKKSPPGKDTVENFGDGTWSICKTGGGSNNPRKEHLHCSETQETLVQDVVDWRQDGDWVYAVGKDGVFAILNFRTNVRAKYEAIEEAPAEHQAQLRRLRTR
jgi:hypothetical protein